MATITLSNFWPFLVVNLSSIVLRKSCSSTPSRGVVVGLPLLISLRCLRKSSASIGTKGVAEREIARDADRLAARLRASNVLVGPSGTYDGDRGALIEQVRQALYASKICSYAQGFIQLQAAAVEHKWPLNLGACAQLWRGGCIIRAAFLDRIMEAFNNDPTLENLLLAPYFREAVDRAQPAWRHVVQTAVGLGIPVPAFSAALAYYDAYRCDRLPANLLQAQRDYFGAHTYHRIDREGVFHTDWIGLRKQPVK